MKNKIYNKIREKRNEMFPPKVEFERYDLIENFGTPVTLSEILMMIEKKGHKVALGANAKFFKMDGISGTFDSFGFPDLNLSKSIQNQDIEVLEKILEIIKE